MTAIDRARAVAAGSSTSGRSASAAGAARRRRSAARRGSRRAAVARRCRPPRSGVASGCSAAGSGVGRRHQPPAGQARRDGRRRSRRPQPASLGAPAQSGTRVRERRRRVDAHRAGDRRRRRLRQRRIGERAAGADAGEDRRAVAGKAEVALQALAEILDLGDQVVAAVVAGREAAQVLRQVDADHGHAVAGQRRAPSPSSAAFQPSASENRNTRPALPPFVGAYARTWPKRPSSLCDTSADSRWQPARQTNAATTAARHDGAVAVARGVSEGEACGSTDRKAAH